LRKSRKLLSVPRTIASLAWGGILEWGRGRQKEGNGTEKVTPYTLWSKLMELSLLSPAD